MRNLKRLLLVLAITLTCNNYSLAQYTHYSEWMANSRNYKVYKSGSYKTFTTSDGNSGDFWRYDDGLMYEAILDTYHRYETNTSLLEGVRDYLKWCFQGSSSPYIKNLETTTLDDMRPGRLVWKYKRTYSHSDTDYDSKYEAALSALMQTSAFANSSRVTINGNTGKGYPWRHKSGLSGQVWLDGIFMGLPFWTLAGPVIGSGQFEYRNWTTSDFFEDAVSQILKTDEKTYGDELGLWAHAWDGEGDEAWSTKNSSFTTGSNVPPHADIEKYAHDGRSSHCWGRALGWYAMAIMETMDNIQLQNGSGTYNTQINTLKSLFKKVIDKVIETRDPSSGVWYCVLDVGDNSSATSPYYGKGPKNNYLEATCSSMFAYCLLHGVAQGYLDSSYTTVAQDVYNSVVKEFIRNDSSNKKKLIRCDQVAGLGGTSTVNSITYNRDGSFAYYMLEDSIDNDSKGVGPFIWASLAAETTPYNYTIATGFPSIANDGIVQFRWSKVADNITTPSSYVSPTFMAKTSGGTTLTNSTDITFVSDNTDVATVAADGTITLAGEAGTANITATRTGGSYAGAAIYTVTTTGADTTKPTLSSSTPATNAIDVAVSGNIVLTFSEDVTINDASNITLTGGAGTLDKEHATTDGATITIPYSGLANSTTYTLNIAADAVKDLSENTNETVNAITFRTIAPDLTAPTLENSKPNSGAKTIAINGNIELTFNEIVSVADASKFTLSGGAGSLTTNNITGDGTTTITIPYTGLSNETNYTFATAAGAVRDASGNLNTDLDNITFTTAAAQSDLVISNTSEVSETFADGTILYSIDSDGRQNSSTKFESNKDIVSGNVKTTGAAIVDKRFVVKFPVAVSSVTIYGYNSSSGRTLNKVSTSTTMEKDSYTDITSSSNINSSSSTPNYNYTFTSSWSTAIAANTYIWFEFNNSCNFYKIEYTTPSTPTPSKVATPVITGTTPFSSSTSVTMSCKTTGATIHYTTDGSAPTSSSATYSEPINISATTIVKAIAIKSGMTDSDVASATFTKSEGGGGTSATITYNLNVGTSASTIIKNSTSTTDATNITNIDIDQEHDGANGTGASNRTTKLAIKTGNNGETFDDNPTNYELFKFTIATGKQFTPSEIAIKVANVGSSSANDIKYKAVLSDESGHSIDGTYIVETQDGTVENFVFANSSNTAFIGNVTLKLWAWQIANSNASAFRMGTPLTITGTIEDSSEPIIPTYTVTATSNNNSWGTVSVDKATAAEDATVTITTSPASGYELTSLAATDGESNPVTITNNQFTMPASNVTVNATFAAMEKVATPSITGTTPFTDNTTATITCATTGATIHYTTDGSTPTASSTTYSSPIAISATTTVKAIAVKEGMTDSDVASAKFTKSGGGGGGSGTVLFSQDFDDATEVAYADNNTARTITTGSGNNIVGTDSETQFSYIGMTAKSGAGIAINSTTGGNSVNATGFFQAYCNATGQNWALVHNTDFADTAPTALKIDMKIYFQQLSSGSDYSVSFAVGDNFENGTSSPTSANVHSGFSILNNSTAKLCQYLTKTGIYDTGITQGSWQDVTWIINNNGEVLTYTDPKGESSTVNNDCFDLWIGITKVAANQAATTATTALQNLYIGDPAGKKNEFRLYEIVVTDLTPTEVAKVATPEITPDDGTVFEGTTQNVSISCSTSGASIYYTLDGTEPTTSSIPYNSTFTIYGTKTVKAIAIKEGMTNSTIASATITNTCLNESTDGTLLLKETATDYTPVAATGVDVTLRRTLQANKWNALCLPFDVTPAMFSSATNGATTNLETLKGVNNGIFTFAPTNSVPAGTPFIAKPAANIANPVFEDVEVKAVDAGSDIKDGYTFQGNYTKVTLDPETNLFISMSQQKLVSPTGSNILQGLRGYFIVPSGEGARFSLNFDGEMIVTDINRLNIEHLPFAIDDKTPIYNLSGQRVSKDYKGIVIINGKKFVRK